MRVLIVDDQRVNRTVPGMLLQRVGCEVFEAESGEEALAFLEHHSVDAILLDIRMPGISGIDVCRQLRKQPAYAGLLIVAYSAHVQLSERDEILAAGFNDMLIKPINRQVLLEALKLPA